MKHGLLIYDQEGFERNRWWIDELVRYSAELQIPLSPYVLPPNGEIDPLLCPEYAVVRAIAPTINEALEMKGVRTFNNAKTSKIANDKWQTYSYFKKLGLPVMPTWLMTGDVPKEATFPCVLKSLDGHGGNEVFWVNDEGEAKEIYAHLKKPAVILQAPCSQTGRDMRLYVLGGKIIASVLRTAKEGFKSNFSLGGNVTQCTPTKEQIDVVNAIYSALNCDFVGVDFILHEGRWVLNEIEDPVGCRMLYATHDINVAKLYVEYLANELNG